MNDRNATVIGAGLAGCEAAWQLAQRGIHVRLIEMKPRKMSPAHHTDQFAELVCSNSFRGDRLSNAVGLLKEEMRILGSLIMKCADETRVPAGGALAVDRDSFSGLVTSYISGHSLIDIVHEEAVAIPDGPVIIATGPLTSDAFAEVIRNLPGMSTLNFYDAAAPIVIKESLDESRLFRLSRYNRGNDYLNAPMTEEEYRTELKKLQKELGELHNRLYRLRIPVIIGYEGWDAAGKGGNIKRIAAALDPRGYEVHPIASPEPHEKARHFLWRFWNRLPKDGHIAIFDRTWYGRVMVERLEGFCSENDWQRAYNEINEFENELHSWGAVVIKFWVQIDNETQLKRFQDRQNTPEKQWKITDEDWRNREKWPQYEDAVNEMLQKTNTSFAPWYILESVDKKYARIKALKIVIREIRKACREKEKNL